MLATRLLQNPQTSPTRFPQYFHAPLAIPPLHSLNSSAVLLVDVPVALLLHPVLENHGDAEDENEVDTNNAKRCSEDLVEILVGEGRERSDAPTLLRCNKGVCASLILYKWRCGSIDIATAVKLEYVSIRFCHARNSMYSTFCCRRDWICGDSRPQRLLKFLRVCSVSTQMATPKPRVKVAQITTNQPWARSHPRFVGRKRAGRESKKVTKMKMALTTPAVNGHCPRSRF
jgi:hypothetical protein